MKKFDVFKTVQLILFIILAAVSLFVIMTDRELYQQIANNMHIRALCILLWAGFILTFLFILMDFSFFSTLKKDYTKLNLAVSSDPIAGIANRYSCDTLIEKYSDRPLPDNVGCIMFDLTNIVDVNQTFGRIAGNKLIHDFSSILQSSSTNLCFVGRNGGNKFLALFESCNTQKMNSFLANISQKVKRYNSETESANILYQYGAAYLEGDEVKTITDLIALANRRIYTNASDAET